MGTAHPNHVRRPPLSEDRLFRRLDVYPDLLRLHHARPERYPFLLESAVHGTPQARFDILFAYPQGGLVLESDGRLKWSAGHPRGADFLQNLDVWWGTVAAQGPIASELPFHGGWFVYLGYELAGQIERGLDLSRDHRSFPVAAAYRIPAAIMRDHRRRDTVMMAEPDRPELVDAMEGDLRCATQSPDVADRALVDGVEEDPPYEYLSQVKAVKEYIREGDVFQVNLSRSWNAWLRNGVSHATVYERLRRQNPAPFAGLAVLGQTAVMSSSPERLVSVRGGRVSTRPIAGTYPRNADPRSDQALSLALLTHPKERAEHIMLIDLERNDLGRVCRPGSIAVNELMVLESYAHVHHIVSSVSGALLPGITPGQVIRAAFPGGTITGCPKVRCMEIINELEQRARGPYTGALGYVNRDGSADFNILIRSIEREADHVRVRAGAGIVADSVAGRELCETRQKARGPLLALTANS